MSGELPTDNYTISSVTVESNQPVQRSNSISRIRFARIIAGHLWKLKFNYSDLTQEEFRTLWAFLLKQRNGFETFTTKLPGHQNPQGNWGVAIQYSSTITDTSIVLSGFSNNDSDAVKAGDFFNIAGSVKIYQVIENGSSDGSGNTTVNFEPPLIKTPGASAAITHTNFTFTVELDTNSFSYTRQGLIYSSFEIGMMEAL